MKFVQSPDGQKVLADAGFKPAKGAQVGEETPTPQRGT
jgi:hypothetical protein